MSEQRQFHLHQFAVAVVILSYHISAACAGRAAMTMLIMRSVSRTRFHSVKFLSLGDMISNEYKNYRCIISLSFVFVFVFSQGESVKYFLDNLEKLGQSVSLSPPPAIIR